MTDAILKVNIRVLRNTRSLLLYRLIQFFCFPFVLLYFIWRWFREPSYRPHFFERFGFLPESFGETKSGSIWLHAVSVGEVVSALPLIRQLQADRPSVLIYLSTSTVAGRNAAVAQAAPLVAGIFYCPIDYVSFIRRALRAIRPYLVVVLETEIWPNLYRETKIFGAMLAVVNGRISDRAWPKYQRWRSLLESSLRCPDLVLVQSETDLLRYRRLGADNSKVSVAANLKYDASLASRRVVFDKGPATHIWIAASTVGPDDRGNLMPHDVDEDDIVLDIFEELASEFEGLLLILAPRQPSRFDGATAKLKSRGIPFIRRSESHTALTQLPGVLLLDTLGELAGLYGWANVAFVGGSLAPRGGHNILEAAAAGTPVIVGPYMQNFAAIAGDFITASALQQVRSAADLKAAVRRLLHDDAAAIELGRRGQRLVRERRGVSAEIAQHLWTLYFQAAGPQSRLRHFLLKPLAELWRAGGEWKRERSEKLALRLVRPPVPVISIGGITIGGAGKTPFTCYLVSSLKRRGFSPAILTRGYRRRSPAPYVILPADAHVPASLTGDEAQILLRTGKTPVGIGADRHETARLLLGQFPETDVLVLDDGFQHARLERDLDVVLIDGLDPFGGGDVVPLGRLREPLTALARAGAFVITRSDDDLRYRSLAERLSELNPFAPVFRTRLRARSWHDYATGRALAPLTGIKVAAFCGIGNPESFWRTLEALGLQVVLRWTFRDHHLYKPAEVIRIAQQAQMQGIAHLVTTEKDRMNCPPHLSELIAPVRLAWLAIDVELDEEERFFTLFEDKLQRVRSEPRA